MQHRTVVSSESLKRMKEDDDINIINTTQMHAGLFENCYKVEWEVDA